MDSIQFNTADPTDPADPLCWAAKESIIVVFRTFVAEKNVESVFFVRRIYDLWAASGLWEPWLMSRHFRGRERDEGLGQEVSLTHSHSSEPNMIGSPRLDRFPPKTWLYYDIERPLLSLIEEGRKSWSYQDKGGGGKLSWCPYCGWSMKLGWLESKQRRWWWRGFLKIRR